ncbi:MAG: Wzz/FepE/Etk N-terminal domain-containing protein, partial [Candidatus Nanopelagicales bacterium]
MSEAPMALGSRGWQAPYASAHSALGAGGRCVHRTTIEGNHIAMEQSAAGGNASLGEFADAMRRRWWMLVLGAVIGVALGSTYLLFAPKTYISTASVLVNPVGGTVDNVVDGARTVSDINLDTEAQLVRSQAVSSIAKYKLETREIVGQLVQHVTVSVPPNTNVLRISFAGSTPEGARAGAAAYASAYLQNREAMADAINTTQV